MSSAKSAKDDDRKSSGRDIDVKPGTDSTAKESNASDQLQKDGMPDKSEVKCDNDKQDGEDEGENDTASPVLSGKRERKRTKKFEISTDEGGHRRRSFKTGSGTPLGQIPNISYLLNAAKGRDDELVFLHRLLFNSMGVATKRKANIRDFSGFVLENEKDRERVKQRITKEPTPLVRKVAQLLDLPNISSPKQALVDAITAFLECPRVVEDRVDLASKAQQKREKKARKAEAGKSGKKSRKSKEAQKSRASKKRKATVTDSESGTEDEEESIDADNVESRAVSASKKRAKTSKNEQKTTSGRKKKSSKIESDDEFPDDEEMDDEDSAQTSGTENHEGENEATKSVGDQGSPKSKATHPSADDEKAQDQSKRNVDSDVDEDDSERPSKKELSDAASKLLSEGDEETLTIRSVRTRLEAQFQCSLQGRMNFLRQLVEENLRSR